MRKIVLYIICMFYLSLSIYAQDDSVFINSDTQVLKEHGFQKSAFVHETYFINPFDTYQIIVEKDSDTVLRYRVAGEIFDENHFLYIGENDSEDKKTIHGWKEIETGIHSKLILQGATYQVIDGVITPKQGVAATKYYRVTYNHDMTPPICTDVIYSHDNVGVQSFNIASNSWFNTEKFLSFSCSDYESGCLCDSNDTACFIENNVVFSTPQPLGHNSEVSHVFFNTVGLEVACNSQDQYKIFYDTLSPDLDIFIDDSLLNTISDREYISNDGVMYDGEQLQEKRFYNIKTPIYLKANSATKINFNLFDVYDNSTSSQGVSGIKSYTLSVGENKQGLWSELGTKTFVLDDYNPHGTKTTTHTYEIIGEEIPFLKNTFTKAGEYQIYITFNDVAGNKARVVLYFNVVANDLDISSSIIQSVSKDSKYGNDSDYYNYYLYLKDMYGNPIFGKEIYNLEHSCDEASVCKTLYQNALEGGSSGDIAINVISENTVSDKDGKILFKLKSFAPGKFTESFTFEMFEWDNMYETVFSLRNRVNIIGNENSFLPLFSGKLESYVDGTWGNEIPLGDDIQYRLQVLENTEKSFLGEMSDFTNHIRSQDSDSDFTLSGALDYNSDGNIYFTGSMVTSLPPSEHNKIGLEVSENSKSAIELSYIISGKKIQHYLSKFKTDKTPVSLSKNTVTLTNPVRIVGKLQGIGNTQNSYERQNTTDLSSGKMRTTMRKNINLAIRSRKHNSIISGVKYIDASNLPNNIYTLESNPDFETLIVHNGNLHIESNFTPSGTIMGLISYIDESYNVQDGYDDIGNIYIDNNVSEIHAALYSDGGVISTNAGEIISGNESYRSSLLQDQLYIKGVLFSRNTLGGATLHGDKYILPGGSKTSDYSQAMQYDLHHIRKGANNCVEIQGSCPYGEYLIIEYDSSIQSMPPKLFSQ